MIFSPVLWFLVEKVACTTARIVYKAPDHLRPSGQTLLPPDLPIFVECFPAWGTYLLVYEWIPPQLALLPAQHHPISSLGFPPTAGLGHLLSVQRQQPKHRGQLEVFRSVDPTAAKLGERRTSVGASVGLEGMPACARAKFPLPCM